MKFIKSEDELDIMIEASAEHHVFPDLYDAGMKQVVTKMEILNTPVMFSDFKRNIMIEIQIRTVGMVLWAGLKHQLC